MRRPSWRPLGEPSFTTVMAMACPAPRSSATDLVEPLLQRHAIELLEPEAGEDLNARLHLVECVVERRPLHLVRALHGRRILDAPVGRQRLARPDRTHLAGR